MFEIRITMDSGETEKLYAKGQKATATLVETVIVWGEFYFIALVYDGEEIWTHDFEGQGRTPNTESLEAAISECETNVGSIDDPWKVVAMSNFGNESFNEWFLSDEDLTEDQAKKCADRMNAGREDGYDIWWVAVKADYKLYKFEP